VTEVAEATSLDWHEVLDFERDWRRAPAAGGATKERVIRERFGLSPARYYQALDRALGRPEALEYDPVLVARLRRMREDRRERRFAARLDREGRGPAT